MTLLNLHPSTAARVARPQLACWPGLPRSASNLPRTMLSTCIATQEQRGLRIQPTYYHTYDCTYDYTCRTCFHSNFTYRLYLLLYLLLCLQIIHIIPTLIPIILTIVATTTPTIISSLIQSIRTGRAIIPTIIYSYT